MNKYRLIYKLKKVFKYALIGFISFMGLWFSYFLVSAHISAFKEPEVPILTFEDFFNKNIYKILNQNDQLKRNNELFTYYIYDNKYQIFILELKNKDIMSKVNYQIGKYSDKKYLKKNAVGFTNINYYDNDPGYGFHFCNELSYSKHIYLKFEESETVLSSLHKKHYYSINYYSDHITIG